MPLVFRAAALIPLALGCSCRLSMPIPGPGAERIRHTEHHLIHARLSADRTVLRVRFSLEGKDAWAVAEINAPAAGGGAPCALNLASSADAEAGLGKKSRNVPVLSRLVWAETTRNLADRLAPADGKSCTLLTTAGRETVVRRVKGETVFNALADRPRGLRVSRRLGPAAATREILASLPADKLPDAGPVLLATGRTPEFVLIDREQNHICYLTVPAQDSFGLPLRGGALPGEPALRQAASLTLRSGLLGILTNPFTTASRSIANVTTMTAAAASRVTGPRSPAAAPPVTAAGPGMDLAAFERYLDTIAEPAVPASLRFLIGGSEFFPEFIQGVQDAKQTVDIQLYIFDNDDYAVQIADLLRARSKDVRVRVLMDEMASLQAAAAPPETPMPADFTPPRDITAYLAKGAPLQVRPMSMSGLCASHQKIIILDKQRAWLGGMNIGREYRSDWHDMMIEVRGPLVAGMQRDFSAAWAHAGFGGDFTALWRKATGAAPRQPKLEIPSGAVPVRPLHTGAWTREIVKAQLEAVRRAKRYIYVENAYLSDAGFIQELILARHRGVDVRVILPRDNDNGIMAANNRSLIPDLRREGVRVYLLPGMSHVKAAIIDGWACTGSANYDRLSLRVNNEFNIGFSHPAAVGELKRRLFDADFRRATEVGAFTEPAPAEAFYNSVIQSVAGQL